MLNIQFMQQSPLTVKIHHFLHKTFRILTSYDQSFFYCQAIAFIWLILHCKNIFSISLQELSSHFLDKYIKNDTPPDRCPLEYYHSNKQEKKLHPVSQLYEAIAMTNNQYAVWDFLPHGSSFTGTKQKHGLILSAADSSRTVCPHVPAFLSRSHRSCSG